MIRNSTVRGVACGIVVANVLMSASASFGVLMVRWNGNFLDPCKKCVPNDQQANQWLQGIDGGSRPAQFYDIDVDGDGLTSDDSVMSYPFSLDVPLNPPEAPKRPDQVVYNGNLPSARFYGGMTAEFANHRTFKFDQAFVENNGSGCDPAQVHADGRFFKNHPGPCDDVAVTVYRPNSPNKLDPLEDSSDDLVRFQAVFLWKKDNFLNGGDLAAIRIDDLSRLSVETTRWWDNVESLRFVLQDGDQLYISEFWTPGAKDDYGHHNELFATQTQWAAYNPSGHEIDFEQDLAVFAPHTFADIQAAGLYIESDQLARLRTEFTFDEFQFIATIPEPASGLILLGAGLLLLRRRQGA